MPVVRTSTPRSSILSWGGVARLSLAILIPLLILRWLPLFGEVLVLLFGAALLASALSPPATWLERRGIPRWLGLLLLYLLLLVLLGLILSLAVPVIGTEIERLTQLLPSLVSAGHAQLRSVPLLGNITISPGDIVQFAAQQINTAVNSVTSLAAGIGRLVLNFLLVVVLAYFIAVDAGAGEKVVTRFVPPTYRPHARRLMADSAQRLSRWLWAQGLVMLYFAFALGIGLKLLGVPFAFSLGAVGGVLEIIPYAGGAVAALLALLSGFMVKPILALWVLLYYFVVVEVEAHVIAPAVLGHVIGIHPAAIIVALVVGAKALGIIGALLAIPVAVVITVVLDEVTATWEAEAESPAEEGPPPAVPVTADGDSSDRE
ncbi:MAG: AI-2E family transporter [Ardenticatenaceae bacterium]|nr:AI-2E family transporter [Ardenticatenaceae bacterium]